MDNNLNKVHNIEPIWSRDSTILILGSFPSVKSREIKFFYGHSQNRFWKVISKIFSEPIPLTIEEKTSFLLKHKIAIWDVIKSCDIVGSSDSSIKNVIPNDIRFILEQSNIDKIYVNGNKALSLYNKYILPLININAVVLPSTSPANATFSYEKLCYIWGKLIIKSK